MTLSVEELKHLGNGMYIDSEDCVHMELHYADDGEFGDLRWNALYLLRDYGAVEFIWSRNYISEVKVNLGFEFIFERN